MQECKRLVNYDFVNRSKYHGRREFLLDLCKEFAKPASPEVNLITGDKELHDVFADLPSPKQLNESTKKECEYLGSSFERFSQD